MNPLDGRDRAVLRESRPYTYGNRRWLPRRRLASVADI
jgi:hypothetical protein